MAPLVGQDAPAGMLELTNLGSRLFCISHRATKKVLFFLPTQRLLDPYVCMPAGRRLTMRTLQRELASLAVEAGAPTEMTALLDLTSAMRPGRHPRQVLVCTVPESSTPERNGSIPMSPPDLWSQYALYLAISEACAKVAGDRHTFAIHCNHGCNRTGLLLVALAMAMSDNPSLSLLEHLIREFARCRRALPGEDAADLGIYDREAFYELYRRCFFLMPVRPLPPTAPSAEVDDEGNLRSWLFPVLVPRRQPRKAQGCMAAYMDSSEYSAVPLPRCLVHKLAKQKGPRQSPLVNIGTRNEMITWQVDRTDIIADITRVVQTGTRVNSSGKSLMMGCMPREIVDVTNITPRHMVSAKADGIRMLLVFLEYGTFLVLRNNVVQGVNISRPANCFEAVLDGELVMPKAEDPTVKAKFYAFDILLWRKTVGAAAPVGPEAEEEKARRTGMLGHLPFHERATHLEVFTRELRETVFRLCRQDAAGELRSGSTYNQAPRILQSFDVEMKPFMCLCHTPLMMAATMQSLRRTHNCPLQPVPAFTGVCKHCNKQPPHPALARELMQTESQPYGWVTRIDGLIFYSMDVLSGAVQIVHKCKPGDLQTVDFMHINGAWFYMNGKEPTELRGLEVHTRDLVNDPEIVQIVELKLVAIEGVPEGNLRAVHAVTDELPNGAVPRTRWAFAGLRDDKTEANSLPVLQNTMLAKVANVWDRSLLQHIGQLLGLGLDTA